MSLSRMKFLLTLGSFALFALALALGACQTDTTDRNSYDASTAPSPGVETTAQQDELSPRIDVPGDSAMADSTM